LKDAIGEPVGVEKGRKFEWFFENFMAQQDGFVYVDKHCRSEVGEIDYFYRSRLCGHPLWEKFRYLFVECKNWKETISSEKIDHFIRLLEAKNAFDCCGVYVTTSNFSPQAIAAVNNARLKNELLILLIKGEELVDLIDSGFKAFLQEKCDEIVAKA